MGTEYFESVCSTVWYHIANETEFLLRGTTFTLGTLEHKHDIIALGEFDALT